MMRYGVKIQLGSINSGSINSYSERGAGEWIAGGKTGHFVLRVMNCSDT